MTFGTNGYPVPVPPVAIYRSADPQHSDRCYYARMLTRTDAEGRRYFRARIHLGWQRLRSAEDFQALNRAIDASLPLLLQKVHTLIHTGA